MRRDLIVPGEMDEIAALPGGGDPRVVREQFTPLLMRMEQEQSPILPSLLKLKGLMTEEDFNKYINTLQNIRRNDTTVMLVTDDALVKTYIEGKFLKQVEDAFGVQFVRVVCLN